MRPGVRARPTDGAGPAQPSLCSVSGHSAKTASEPVCPPQLSNQGSPRQGRDTVGGSSPSRRSAASCASQFSDPLAGPLCRNSSGRRSLRQKASKPNRASSLVGAPNWPGRWNGHGSSLQLASTALYGPPLLSTVACSGRPSAVGAPVDRPPCWATVSPRATALLQHEPRAALLPPGVIASRGKAGFHPDPNLREGPRCTQGWQA